MKCERCGKDLGSSSRCSFCGYENFEEGNVREMTRSEKNFYNGVTIDANSAENGSHSERNYYSGQNFSSRMTYINLGSGGFFSRLFDKFIRGLMENNLLAKIIAGLIFIALAGIFFFVALPIMFFMFALGVALFLYAKFKGKF